MQTPYPMQVDRFRIRKASLVSYLLFFYTASFCGWILELLVSGRSIIRNLACRSFW